MHGHELRGGRECWSVRDARQMGDKGEKEIGTIVIEQSIKYT